MQLFSRGGFYFGHEDEDFNAISIHIRNYTLEWEGNAKKHHGRHLPSNDGSSNGKGS